MFLLGSCREWYVGNRKAYDKKLGERKIYWRLWGTYPFFFHPDVFRQIIICHLFEEYLRNSLMILWMISRSNLEELVRNVFIIYEKNYYSYDAKKYSISARNMRVSFRVIRTFYVVNTITHISSGTLRTES